MDKAMQNNTELQDEELYALLDKAMETDSRLCVSEELIQKTLDRVAKETDDKVISFEAAKKRKLSFVKYAGVAVAALFVAVLGLNTLGNRNFSADKTQMEAAMDGAGSKLNRGETCDSSETSVASTNSADDADGYRNYSKSGGIGEQLFDSAMQEEVQNPAEAPETEYSEEDVETGLAHVTVKLSRELSETLAAIGSAPVSDTAECWEFAESGIDWEAELLNTITAAMAFEEELPYGGDYRYVLEGNGGTRNVLECKNPLDLIIRIETNRGVLWGLFGETGSFVMEHD